ncbi:hypothetical protein Salat_1155400 [Sesamum alatum]|uniref:Uncharacterized protein n=1 Tax=Sesamum alatum TaxID=300844 RepID=A0AAE2CNE5_9LAMI|nr:hypothetical protein Salat_1155400 [Sesamum alatum]
MFAEKWGLILLQTGQQTDAACCPCLQQNEGPFCSKQGQQTEDVSCPCLQQKGPSFWPTVMMMSTYLYMKLRGRIEFTVEFLLEKTWWRRKKKCSIKAFHRTIGESQEWR